MKNQIFLKRMRPFIVWGVGDFYFVLAVTVAIFFGVISPDLQKQLHLTSSQLGFLGFGFFLSFGVMQLLMGGLIDSWGPRPVITFSALVAAIGLFLLSTSLGFYQAFFAQLVMGAGFSISYVGAIYLASIWFSEKYFSLLSGVTQMTANIMSALFISSMVLFNSVDIDFRFITNVFACVSLFSAFISFLVIRKPCHFDQKKQQRSEFWKDLYKLLQIPQFWLSSIYFSANISVFLAFSSLWNIPDSLAYGHDLKISVMLSATLRFGGALGALLSGLIASYMGTCSKLAKWYSTGALLLGSFLIYGPVFPVWSVFLIFVFWGFFLGGSSLGFPLVGQYTSSRLKGTGFGIMTSMGYLLCAFLQYIVGAILSENPSSSISMFKIALTPLVIVLVIGWFSVLQLKDVKRA